MLRYRLGLMARTMLPAFVLGLLLAGFFLAAGAHWPETWHAPPPRVPQAEIDAMKAGHYRRTSGWDDLIAFSLVVLFLFTKAWTMMKQIAKPYDWLAVALSTANVFFSLLYIVAIFQMLFPLWFATHYGFGDELRDKLRYGLIAVLAWAVVTLGSTPTRAEQRRLLASMRDK